MAWAGCPCCKEKVFWSLCWLIFMLKVCNNLSRESVVVKDCVCGPGCPVGFLHEVSFTGLLEVAKLTRNMGIPILEPGPWTERKEMGVNIGTRWLTSDGGCEVTSTSNSSPYPGVRTKINHFLLQVALVRVFCHCYWKRKTKQWTS